MDTGFQMFQTVGLTHREDQKVAVDPSTAGHKQFCKRVEPGTTGSVSPLNTGAAFKLILPRSARPPYISTELTLHHDRAFESAPLALISFKNPDGTTVNLDQGPIVDLAKLDELVVPKPAGRRTLDLSIIDILNTTILSSDSKSIEHRVARGVLRHALARIRAAGSGPKGLAPNLTLEEHRQQVDKLDIRAVMWELQNHPDGFDGVRQFCELFLKEKGGNDKVKTMRLVL
jgi:hypothetical protein